MKKAITILSIVATVLFVVVVGGSFYMLDYSLAPDANRTDRDSCFRQQFESYPESKLWVDSLTRVDALRDTFLTMSDGRRMHGFYVDKGCKKTAVVVHGWRDCAIKFLWLARIYEHELDYNVVMPELHACGESEGDAIRMGWKDRLDVKEWMTAFLTDTMVVHGVSMGAATTMMLSGEQMPTGIKELRFVEDCGYTSVWDEFAGQLKEEFGLPAFPLMYSTSLLCKWRYGWSFGEASALRQVAKCPYPMLFIHGSKDTFVPTSMVHSLFEAKSGKKRLWIAEGAGHALSYKEHKAEYISLIKTFLQ
ncbi:alpha/beta hydrolase [Prevotella sp. E13-17]|uniref:alpha/beta hydrolase n=1 Tax=Prevotella sp. E13-17 TaxID=2913616 RepID=UPI001EDA40F0|nr:alpha/beta hydrolase [Prevotella sp. E13-17]UKK52178.1 alpha/beta hydrolase [Prevotella sp. E13-17]